MKAINRLVGLSALLAAAALFAAGCNEDTHKEGGTHEPGKKEAEAKAPAQATKEAGGPQTKCPVMGEDINKTIFVDYQGHRVYFCCGMCPPKFKENPEKYLTAMAKEGIVLEKSPASSK